MEGRKNIRIPGMCVIVIWSGEGTALSRTGVVWRATRATHGGGGGTIGSNRMIGMIGRLWSEGEDSEVTQTEGSLRDRP